MDRPNKQVEQVADDTDPDGLPRADAAFFAALETDALTARCFALVCTGHVSVTCAKYSFTGCAHGDKMGHHL
jgi:hypothetical protein